MIDHPNVSELSSTNAGDSEGNNAQAFDHWYFAYGSNLCVEQIRIRLGTHVFDHQGNEELRPRLAKLPNHQVDFSMLASDGHYYANLAPSLGEVIGVLYRCDSIALLKLDVFEDGYHRRCVTVFDATGQAYDAEVYVARPENVVTSGKPTPEYLNRILRGGLSHGVPMDYLLCLEMLAGRSVTNSTL
jgi:gamma-glutamylcyclotransferase (GGCT)/AIG2-like uncharacterized protein YtfP